MASADTTGFSLFRDTSESILGERDRARLAARDLDALQDALGYRFDDRGLLEEALCHSSFSHEHGLAVSNERLEFLGDSVLGFIVARALYGMYPEAPEGELTRMRSELVREGALYRQALALRIPDVLLHGHSMKDGAIPQSVCADAVEALLGAVCLDGGIEAAERVVERLFLADAEFGTRRLDPKSQLQIWLQARDMPLPHYELLSVRGPSHAPVFRVRARVGGVEYLAEGSTRRGAESAVAEQALAGVRASAAALPDGGVR